MSGRVAPPLQISETSVLDGIVGLLKSSLGGVGDPGAAEEAPDQVVWVKFDVNGLAPDVCGHPPQAGHLPLLLIGYANGIQVWDTENPEQVTELLSLRDGRCAAATMLPAPTRKQDGFSTARPLLMLVDDDLAADPPVRVLSLHTGRPLKKGLDVAAPVLDVKANEEVVAVIGREEVTLLDAGTLATLSKIQDCMGYTDLNRGWGLNPVALGASWMAYSSSAHVDPRTMTPVAGSAGGRDPVAKLMGMAQKTGTDLWYLGGASVKKVADLMNGVDGVQSLGHSPSSVSSDTSGDYAARGMVRVVGDLDSDDAPTTVAYFRATADGRPIGAMAFDPLGMLLATTSVDGQATNIFSLSSAMEDRPNRVVPCHVYTLVRGITTALVRTIQFSADSRWVAVGSDHGTCHLFPVRPDGGPISGRTHAAPERSTEFEITAGLSSAPAHHPLKVAAVARLKHAHAPAASTHRPTPPPPPIDEPGSSLMAPPSTSATGLVRRLPGVSMISFRGCEITGCKAAAAPFTIMGATMQGALLEYTLFPHRTDRDSAQAIRGFARSTGYMVVTYDEAPVQSAVTSTIRTVGNVIEGVREIVGPGDRPPNSNTASPDRFEGWDDFAVLCLAPRWWDLCRRRDWSAVAGRINNRADAAIGVSRGGGGGGGGERGHAAAGGNHAEPETNGWSRSFAQDGTVSPGRKHTWLAHVDMATYSPPHRRLWMGPQTSVHKFGNVANSTEALQGGLMLGPLTLTGDVRSDAPKPERKDSGGDEVLAGLAEAMGITS